MKNKNLNILIVEDEVISAEYLKDILESFNISNIYDTSNMDNALDIVKKYKIDIVFMDINIDGSTDGITCAKILNEHYFLPIIFTTAYGDSATIAEASDTNIFGYLIKPFEANEVEASLTTALKTIETITNNTKPINKSNENIIELGMGQKYNLLCKTFYINNIAINLTNNELNILNILCNNLDTNISYEVLKEKIWNNKDISNSTIRDTISRLKKKTPNLNITNIISFGYILNTK